MLRSKNSWKTKVREVLLSIFEPEDVDGYALDGSELPWQEWLQRFFPHVATFAPAEHHESIWDWIARLRKGVKPKAKIALLPRGGAKSSTVEMGVAYVGARLTRRFALYICETQDQADEHVGNIGTLFEGMGVERAVGKYGNSKGWKRDQLRTANGFNVTGIGIKTAARGIRLGKYRPDLIIIDDIDNVGDSKAAVLKKIVALTKSLLPAGSSDCAVIFVQNKISRDGIAAQLADGRADFLLDREPVIERPAILGLEVTREQNPDGTFFWKIIKGVATWVGQSLETCQKQIAEWGLSAFLNEAQHDVDIAEGGLWNLDRDIKPFRVYADGLRDFGSNGLPHLHRIVVAVDPSGGAAGDEVGLVVSGVGRIGRVLHAYVLESLTLQCSPEEMATTALDLYDRWHADELVVEVNFGGEMAVSTFKAAGLERSRRIPPITMVRVSRGKLIRAAPVHLLYDKGQVHHREDPSPTTAQGNGAQISGATHAALERQMCKWQPGMPSPGALDAAVISLSRLFDLAEMVNEVKTATPYAPSNFIGSVPRSGKTAPVGKVAAAAARTARPASAVPKTGTAKPLPPPQAERPQAATKAAGSGAGAEAAEPTPPPPPAPARIVGKAPPRLACG